MPNDSSTVHSLSVTNTLRGSAKAIIAISPWKSRFATSSEDGSVKVWDSETLKVIHGFLPSCFSGFLVTSILWRNDKTLLVSAEKTLYSLTLPDDASTLLTRSAASSYDVAEDEINDLITLDKSKVALADDAGQVYIFDTIKGLVTNTLKHGEIVTSLTLFRDADGTHLVSGSLDTHLKLWNLKSARVAHDIHVADAVAANQGESVGAGLINPPYVHSLVTVANTEGKDVLFAGLGNGDVFSARLQGVGKKRHWVTRQVHAHGIAVGALAVLDRHSSASSSSSSSSLIVSGSNDKTCKLWSSEGFWAGVEEPLATAQMPGKINALAALEDGRILAGDVLGNLNILTVECFTTKEGTFQKRMQTDTRIKPPNHDIH